MRKATLATLMLVVCAAWAAAQSYPSGETGKSNSPSQTTVKGCLSKSDGGYTLTEKSGTTYQLTGDTSKLAEHVGHEVQVKGTTGGSSATPSASSSGANATGQPTLDVTSFKHISSTCGSKSQSNTQTPPMSEKPPTSKY
jgi:hypothetical protein